MSTETCSVNPHRPPDPDRLEKFQRLVRGADRENLLRNVDIYLVQLDAAIERGDRHAQAWARKRWNIVWDELDRRDGIPAEVA